MEDRDELKFYISQIAKIMGLSEPVGFMLSYEMGDIWIDIYVERGSDEWENKTYTISVPKDKKEKLKKFIESAGTLTEISSDSERAWASFSQEEWEKISLSITNLL